MVVDQLIGVGLAIAVKPVGNQRALAAARGALDQNPLGFLLQKAIERCDVAFAAEIETPPWNGVGLVPEALALEGVGHIIGRKRLVEDLPQIHLEPLREGRRRLIVLDDREAASSDAFLQVGLSRGILRGGCDIFSAFAARVLRRSEIEERAARHLRVIQYTVQDLELSDAAPAPMFLEPRLLPEQVQRIRILRGYPTIALSQHADEVGSCAVDLDETDRQHLTAFGLLDRNAPAQINVNEFDEPVLQLRPQTWENLADQKVALLPKIPKGRG